jgi:FtsP/CotA-like multicopper oxidase with cupredoxin domain
MTEHSHGIAAETCHFPTDSAGLSEAVGSQVVDLDDGDEVDLRAPDRQADRRCDRADARHNRSIPGPTLCVGQGTEIVGNASMRGDLETTVHWHRLRLDNRYDGTHDTQRPIPVGGRFSYPIRFPRPLA